MGLFSGIGNFLGLGDQAMGGLLGGALGFFGQQSANQTNMDLASSNNATSINLANTAHQREVQDLIAAGLNPMLSTRLGGNATPPLQQATVQNSGVAGSSSAMATYSAIQQGKVADSQVALNSANVLKTVADTNVSKATLGQISATVKQIMANVANTSARTAQARGSLSYLLGGGDGYPSSSAHYVGDGLTSYNVK